MPLTAIDPVTALVVIDLQKGIATGNLAHPPAEVVARSAALAAAFRAKGLPVILVNVDNPTPRRTDSGPMKFDPPADWAEIVPEMDARPTDLRVTKSTFGAFIGTSLNDDLQARGVTQIVICGISTSIGVESTARSAYDLRYNITFVTDAMTDRVAAAHENSVGIIFPRLGETTTTSELLAKLA